VSLGIVKGGKSDEEVRSEELKAKRGKRRQAMTQLRKEGVVLAMQVRAEEV
jgi:hypothetical protein